LQIAIRNNRLDIVDLLIKEGASIFSKNTEQKTALHLACANEKSSFELVPKLINAGAIIDIQDSNKQTPLIVAIINRIDVASILMLINSEANVNHVDRYNWTSLLYACRWGENSVIKHLLDKQADANVNIYDDNILITPLFLSIAGHKPPVCAELLLDYGAKVSIASKHGWLPLHECCHSRSYKSTIVKLLLKKGDDSVDPNAKNRYGNTALHSAASAGNLDILQLLLDVGASMDIKDAEGQTVLSKAASQDSETIVQFFLDHGLNVNIQDENKMTGLHRSASKNHTNIVKLLLDSKASVDIQDSEGHTALHLAALCKKKQNLLRRHPEIFYLREYIESKRKRHPSLLCNKISLKKGNFSLSDTNKEENMATAANTARPTDSTDIVRQLIAHGANMNIVSQKGETALHNAVSRNSLDVAKLLLSEGANVNIQNCDGETALHQAVVVKGRKDIIILLCKHKANPDLLDNLGNAALDLVKTNRYQKIIMEHKMTQ